MSIRFLSQLQTFLGWGLALFFLAISGMALAIGEPLGLGFLLMAALICPIVKIPDSVRLCLIVLGTLVL